MKKVLLFIAFLTLSNGKSFAQSLEIGYGKYQRGDFQGAINSLQNALKNPINSKNFAQIYKFLGISYYANDNKKDAAESFRKALGLNSKISLHPDEVIDSKVIDFFEGIRSIPSPNTPDPRSIADTPPLPKSPVAPLSVKSPETLHSKPSSPSRPGKVETRLRVQTDAPQSIVMIDGVFAGSGNDLLNVQPGLTEISVEAPGYRSRTLKLDIKRDQETRVKVALSPDKGSSKQARNQPKSALSPYDKPKGQPPREEDTRFDEVKKTKPKKRNLADEFEQDTHEFGAAGLVGEDGVSPLSPEDNLKISAKSRAKTKKSEYPLALALIPFGFGQFLNDRPILGSFFLASELVVLNASMQLVKQSNQDRDDANIRSKSVQNGQKITAADEEFISKKETSASKKASQATLTQIGFALLWLTGATQASIDMQSPAKKAQVKSNGIETYWSQQDSGLQMIYTLNF